MQPYDPLTRLNEEVTHGEALHALELCLRFFAASTIADFEQIRTQAGAVLDQHPRPIDPLDFLYRRLAAESSERLTFLKAIQKWAQQHDPAAHIIDITPSRWKVTVHSHETTREADIEIDWSSEEDEANARITPDNDEAPLIVSLLDADNA